MPPQITPKTVAATALTINAPPTVHRSERVDNASATIIRGTSAMGVVSFASRLIPRMTPKMIEVAKGDHLRATTTSVTAQRASIDVATRTDESMSVSSALWIAYGCRR